MGTQTTSGPFEPNYPEIWTVPVDLHLIYTLISCFFFLLLLFFVPTPTAVRADRMRGRKE